MKNISVLYLPISTAVHYMFVPLQTKKICETSPSVAMRKTILLH